MIQIAHYHLDETLIAKDAVAVDIGAAVGDFALGFKWLFPSSKVWCFEPSLEGVAEFLTRRAAKAFPNEDCPILPIAVAGKTGIREFVIHDREKKYRTESNGFWHSPTRPILERLPVFAIGIVDLLDAISVEVDVMKIDVEGAEYEIIRGLADARQKPKQICMEVHNPHPDNPDRKPDVEARLNDAGYCVRKVSRAIWTATLKS